MFPLNPSFLTDPPCDQSNTSSYTFSHIIIRFNYYPFNYHPFTCYPFTHYPFTHYPFNYYPFLGGEKRLATSCWLEDCLGDIRNVGHIRLKCAMHQTLASKHDYLDLVRGILAYLYASIRQVRHTHTHVYLFMYMYMYSSYVIASTIHCVSQTVDRAQIGRSLELLSKLSLNQSHSPSNPHCLLL